MLCATLLFRTQLSGPRIEEGSLSCTTTRLEPAVSSCPMKSIIAYLILAGAAMSYAQIKSPYAPNPVGVVKVLPRFLDDDDNTNSANSTNSTNNTNSSNGVNLPPRLGEDATVRPAPSTPSSLAGTNVDPELANRVAQWPDERKPFWYQNAQAIHNHHNQPVNSLPGPPPRSPFAANLRN